MIRVRRSEGGKKETTFVNSGVPLNPKPSTARGVRRMHRNSNTMDQCPKWAWPRDGKTGEPVQPS